MLMNHGKFAAANDIPTPDIASALPSIPAEHRTSEPRSFELPMSVWNAMFASYAIFFAALFFAARHDPAALFMIGIGIAYTMMYFGTAAMLNSVRRQTPRANTWADIETYTGPLGFNAAIAQILIVPALVALFGCVIAVIYAVVSPS